MEKRDFMELDENEQNWEIYKMLSVRSQFVVTQEITNPIEAKSLSNFALPMTGKYQWYRFKDDNTVKLRKCKNDGCDLFLKWNDEIKKYEHWKYDANTGRGGFVSDKCAFYGV